MPTKKIVIDNRIKVFYVVDQDIIKKVLGKPLTEGRISFANLDEETKAKVRQLAFENKLAVILKEIGESLIDEGVKRNYNVEFDIKIIISL